MAIKTSKFRSPINNMRYTKQLFWDEQRMMPVADRKDITMFSLHDDVEGLINFRKEYVKDMDPTGYKTAVRLLENYDHWQLLMKTKWFQEAKKIWDVELAAKMDAMATDVLKGIMNGGDDVKVSEQIAAAKAILDKAKTIGKPEKEASASRGRPSKEEVQGELKRQAELSKEEQDDLARIRRIK